MTPKWDARFINLAGLIGSWSKDPSTKVGAVIVNDLKLVVGIGFNGFPRGVADDEARYADRETKLSMVVHAEANAILNAITSPRGCTIYVWPRFSCNECAKLIIQSGIVRVISPPPADTKWKTQYDTAIEMYGEAGVRCDLVDEPPK